LRGELIYGVRKRGSDWSVKCRQGTSDHVEGEFARKKGKEQEKKGLVNFKRGEGGGRPGEERRS